MQYRGYSVSYRWQLQRNIRAAEVNKGLNIKKFVFLGVIDSNDHCERNDYHCSPLYFRSSLDHGE